jgi:hypothetical protein
VQQTLGGQGSTQQVACQGHVKAMPMYTVMPQCELGHTSLDSQLRAAAAFSTVRDGERASMVPNVPVCKSSSSLGFVAKT